MSQRIFSGLTAIHVLTIHFLRASLKDGKTGDTHGGQGDQYKNQTVKDGMAVKDSHPRRSFDEVQKLSIGKCMFQTNSLANITTE